MNLSSLQQDLLAVGQEFVRKFVDERGSFSMFAIARSADGRDQCVQSSGEFSNITEKLTGMFQALWPLARDGQIDGTVLCSYMPEGTGFCAIFDVESRSDGRVIAMVQYRKKLFGGWTSGAPQFTQDKPRVFAP